MSEYLGLDVMGSMVLGMELQQLGSRLSGKMLEVVGRSI